MKTFALFVAPWDLAERSTRDLLRWTRDQGLNTIYLASVYHAGWFLHPHHRRKTYMVEDGTCYFHPDPAQYQHTSLKPQLAKLAADKDWIAEACAEARDLDLKVFLWTVCLHNSRLGLLHPDLTCQNVYGDSYPHALCPSHPDVRSYVTALLADQARYQPDGLLLEATGYHRGRTHGNLAGGIAGHHHERDGLPMRALEQHLLNLSFAPTDCRAAQAGGIDIERLRETIKDHLDAFFAAAPQRASNRPDTLDKFRETCPDLSRYEKVLDEQVAAMIAQARSHPATRGLHIISDSPRLGVDAMLVGCYNQPAEAIAPIIRSARERVGERIELIAGLRLGFNPPPAALAINSLSQGRQIARVLSLCDVQGVAFYFYGEAPAPTLGWIRPMIDVAAGRHQSRSRTAIEPVRVALIGAGVIGEIHLRALSDVQGVVLRSVFDVNASKASHLASKLQIDRAVANVDELLDDDRVDLVVVATPPHIHARLACRVLDAGKHLLLEKPLGLCLADADAIVDAAEVHPSQATGVALVHRYDGNRFAARDLIAHGAIGPVRYVRYHWGRNMYSDPRFDAASTTDRKWLVDASISGGGLLPSSAIHTLSVLSFLLGDPRFVSVSGSVRRLHPRAFDGIEDDVTLLLKLSGDTEAVFEESWACNFDYDFWIHGDLGHLHLSGPQSNDVSLTGVCRGPIPNSLLQWFEGNRIACRPHELDDRVSTAFHGLAASMVAACRGEKPGELPDIIHARNMRAVIAAAITASEAGQNASVAWRNAAAKARRPVL
jgi:predicted dehydrogenase